MSGLSIVHSRWKFAGTDPSEATSWYSVFRTFSYFVPVHHIQVGSLEPLKAFLVILTDPRCYYSASEKSEVNITRP